MGHISLYLPRMFYLVINCCHAWGTCLPWQTPTKQYFRIKSDKQFSASNTRRKIYCGTSVCYTSSRKLVGQAIQLYYVRSLLKGKTFPFNNGDKLEIKWIIGDYFSSIRKGFHISDRCKNKTYCIEVYINSIHVLYQG